MNGNTLDSENDSMTPGSVFVMASVSPDTFSLDRPAGKNRIFGPFEPIPLDMVPIRDMEHLDRLMRWDIYVHGDENRGKMYRLNIKGAVKHKTTWSLDTVEVIDVRRIAFTLGLVKLLDLSRMHIDTEDFEAIIHHVGVFTETTDTRHWTFGILGYFINLLQRHAGPEVLVHISCSSMAAAHKAALWHAWGELPSVVDRYAPSSVLDLTNKIVLTEEDEEIIYCNK